MIKGRKRGEVGRILSELPPYKLSTHLFPWENRINITPNGAVIRGGADKPWRLFLTFPAYSSLLNRQSQRISESEFSVRELGAIS